MEISEKSLPRKISDLPEIDISQKLTANDIEIIERYRQTKRTSVLTILFTDIVGFTGFTYQAGELVSGRFRHIHDEIIISQVKKDGYGEIIKQIGDSFLIIFSDPTLAVKHALKLQELFRLNSENLTYKDYNLKIRIGLHMGQVSVEDHIVSDVFGTHVNIASRMMSLAKGGQVLVSGSVWENASGWLKDEKDIEVSSVTYGKIRLKGIDKPTDIYEFYTEKTGKIGIPKPLSRKRQKVRFISTFLITILAIIIFIPVYFLFIKKSEINKKNIENTREKIFLADIDSYDEDIVFAVNWSRGRTGKIEPAKNQLELIEPEIIHKINDKYQELLKTNFIVNFDIENENDLKRQYAKAWQLVARNLHNDTNLNFNSNYYVGVIPRLYKFKNKEKYWLMAEFFGNIFCTRTKIVSTIDSVPYYIHEITQSIIVDIKKNAYAQGEILKVNADNILIHFYKDYKIPAPGVTLRSSRLYKRPMGVKTGINIKRLIDLEKALKYYGTVQEWINKIDTSHYVYSYNEYKDLKHGFWKAPKCDFYEDLAIEMKLIEVYDSTALARITHKKYPWVELEVGDKVELN